MENKMYLVEGLRYKHQTDKYYMEQQLINNSSTIKQEVIIPKLVTCKQKPKNLRLHSTQ